MGAGGEASKVARILVVDDEPDVRFILKLIFESAGYIVVEAAHGAAALDRAQESRPHLVVTDVMMPVMGGRELIERLHADTATARIPIMLISSNPDSATGADVAFVKPFRANELVAAAARLIRGKD